ncbi:hypothetical protein [Nitrospira sp. Kam-Ns4a]
MVGGERQSSRTPGHLRSATTLGVVICVLTLLALLAQAGRTSAAPAADFDPSAPSRSPWTALIAQADELGLPTGFLHLIPPGFVKFEFSDLRTFAAEYHPDEHRMLLNRSLSFNRAGRVLWPLAKLTHNDLKTLYHELFHAYADFIHSNPDVAEADPGAARLLAFEKKVQQCRYQFVEITPVHQRKTATETRLLTERESWEALNETWAVFVGWAIWTKLELATVKDRRQAAEQWLARLQKADRDAEILGYYEPETAEERAVTHKRHLAPIHRITPAEVAILLEVVLGESPQDAQRAASVMEQTRPLPKGAAACAD